MALVRLGAGLFGISSAPEAAFKTEATIDRVLWASGPAIQTDRKVYDTGVESRGREFSSGLVALDEVTGVVFRGRANDLSVPMPFAHILGVDAKTTPGGATNARQHSITHCGLAAELKSYALQAQMSSAPATTALPLSPKFYGCVARRVAISSTAGSPVDMEAEWSTSGFYDEGEDMSAIAAANRPQYSPFRHSNTFLHGGSAINLASLPTNAGTAGPTTTHMTAPLKLWSNYVVGWSLEVVGPVDEDGGHVGTIDGTASSLPRSATSATLRLSLRLDDAQASLIALTQDKAKDSFSFCLYNWTNSVIETGFARGVTIALPKCDLADVNVADRNGMRIADTVWTVCDNGTQAPITVVCLNNDDQDYA